MPTDEAVFAASVEASIRAMFTPDDLTPEKLLTALCYAGHVLDQRVTGALAQARAQVRAHGTCPNEEVLALHELTLRHLALAELAHERAVEFGFVPE